MINDYIQWASCEKQTGDSSYNDCTVSGTVLRAQALSHFTDDK